MRLINADTLMRWFDNYYDDEIVTVGYVSGLIIDEPTIDAVGVVRCRDCKWCVEHYDTDGNAPYWFCKNWDGATDSDGYCYEAERKEE